MKYTDNLVINTKGMQEDRLTSLFDMLFNAEESVLADNFYKFIEDEKEMLENAIVEQYHDLVESVPYVTDGKKMFEWWSLFWFREGWVQDAKGCNRAFEFNRDAYTKKYVVNEIYE
tara:strand:+ start:125 stop:472 length:348 start_codon:yes stop_codon:yes gene_type:complete